MGAHDLEATHHLRSQAVVRRPDQHIGCRLLEQHQNVRDVEFADELTIFQLIFFEASVNAR